jgi:eukaryotic-like serine/threonine-protein kinase
VGFALPRETTLSAEIGAGTTFEVALVRWRGRELVARRLRSSLRGRRAGERAFLRHLTVLERLIHPAVPALVLAGRDCHGPFALEERMRGMPLRQLVSDHRRAHGPLADRLLRGLAAAAFEALAEVHELADERGPMDFVHGDLAPDHLFVAATGTRVTAGFVDFGLARLRGLDGEKRARGTLPYVAPELARGEAAATAATDAFSLAACFAFAALGAEPCRLEGPARLVEVAERGLDLEALAAAPLVPSTREILLSALRYDPHERLSDPRTIAARFRGT